MMRRCVCIKSVFMAGLEEKESAGSPHIFTDQVTHSTSLTDDLPQKDRIRQSDDEQEGSADGSTCLFIFRVSPQRRGGKRDTDDCPNAPNAADLIIEIAADGDRNILGAAR